jgi:hypothetical protein
VPTQEPDDIVAAVLTSVTRAGAHHNVAVWAVVEQFFIKAEQTRKRATQEVAERSKRTRHEIRVSRVPPIGC